MSDVLQMVQREIPQTVRKLIRSSAVAGALGVDRTTINNWLDHGLPCLKIGTSRWFYMEDVIAWLDSHRG